MNNFKWEIIEQGNFGPIRIGMAKSEINAILGHAHFSKDSPYPGTSQDIYGEKNVIIEYFENDGDIKASYIEVAYPIKVMYFGEDLRPFYVATPDGSLKEYDPITDTERTVNTDMPSDPNDPVRKNNIDPFPRSGKGN